MKAFILVLFMALTIDFAFSQGDAPPFVQGQGQTTKTLGSIIEVPNNLVTKTSSSKALIELEENNILVNPSFEHVTPATGWTTTGVTPSAGTPIHGKKSLCFTASSQTFSATQSSTLYQSQFADGVNGFAYIRVKSNHTGTINVCTINAGTTSTSLCIPVTLDNKWGEYPIPFMLGGTSNGISVSAASGTGTTCIDEAKVGAYSLRSSIDSSKLAVESYFPNPAACSLQRTSATIGAFTNDTDCVGPVIVRQKMGQWLTTDADNLIQSVNNLPPGLYKATWFVPTSTSANVEAVLTMTDGTTTCSAMPGNNGSIQLGQVISCTFEYSTTGNRSFQVLVASASGTMTTNQSIGFAKFILEYYGSSPVYPSACGAACETVLSAKISTTGVVSSEDYDWINGSCAVTATSTYTCNFGTNSGITVAPNCTVTSDLSQTQLTTGYPTSTQVQMLLSTSAGVPTAGNINIICKKTGLDLQLSRMLVGFFKETRVSPGVNKSSKCSIMNAGASASTACSSTPCVEYYDSCQTAAPCVWNGTGTYTCTWGAGTWAPNVVMDCGMMANGRSTTAGAGSTGTTTIHSNLDGSYSLTVYGVSSAFAAQNTYFSAWCEASSSL